MTKRPDVHITPALQEALPYIRIGMTARQIAAVLGISTEAARARVHRAARMGLVESSVKRRQSAVGTMANIARKAMVDGDVQPPFRLPAWTPFAVRDWLKSQVKSPASIEDVVRSILVDAYFEATGEEAE